jgi:hypothetical protein
VGDIMQQNSCFAKPFDFRKTKGTTEAMPFIQSEF